MDMNDRPGKNSIKPSNRRGFTIIELFVSMVALLILMAIVYYLFGYHAVQGLNVEGQIDQQQDARMALQLISRDLRSAHSYEFDGSTLKIYVFKGKPTVSFAGKGSNATVETVEYSHDKATGKLMFRAGKTGSESKPKEIASNVSQFKVFTKEDYVAINFEAEVDVKFERETYTKVKTTLLTKVFPRFIYQAKKFKGFFSLVDEYEDY